MGINRYRKSISSGILKSSSRILEEEGWLNGATLTGGSTDAKVIFYDSADEDLGDKKEIGFVSKDVPRFEYAVHCAKGIYAEVINGAEYFVIYSIL